ncbi:phage portal protein [Prevotella sp. E2-28]|uniref:phage portal protein n=1 Tax=Prevotella sp. E2-28 TaxID=2913620 RepID=UPI001EDA5B74|nr:phage portal protein [Prevotella sp. E2-28]UKK52674.1 phage portal protein [Prevotella sp. E2-28]
MDNIKPNYKEILTREPFYEVMPNGYKAHRVVRRGQKVYEPVDNPLMRVLTQADFLRMYYPSGHAINDPLLYPDIVKKNPENGKTYVQPIMRTAFAFQQVITTKQRVHITGNDIQFELSGKVGAESEELQKQLDFTTFRQGWLDMDMEHAFYDFTEYKIVGDAAIVFYFDEEGHARARTLSYMKGDTLYPHIDSLTGKMELFARKFSDYDENGKFTSENIEIWDDKYLYRARRSVANTKTEKVIEKIKDFFGISGYEIYYQEPHGFDRVPVAYHREPYGPCFMASQQTIETYEEAFSYFCENNRAYAFPIMWSRGDGVEFKPDEITGAVKYIEIEDNDGAAGFLEKAEVSAAFNAQLKLLYDMIYEQSFGVKPPELKSGDLPGVAVKLLFSPAIEQAIHDSQKLQPFLNELVYFVCYAYGFEKNCQASLLNLSINAWIEPYIHQNDSELMTNLATGVANGFLSRQTASERASKYSRNDEFQRIMDEELEKRKLDAQFELDKMKAETNEAIREAKATARNGGQDVNTGNGKRGGRTTDKWGNHEGENNWEQYNRTH